MQDNIVQLEDIIPPLRDLPTATLYELALQPLIPVEVLGDRQYYISLRHGILTNKARLIRLLEGKTTELTAFVGVCIGCMHMEELYNLQD